MNYGFIYEKCILLKSLTIIHEKLHLADYIIQIKFGPEDVFLWIAVNRISNIHPQKNKKIKQNKKKPNLRDVLFPSL